MVLMCFKCFLLHLGLDLLTLVTSLGADGAAGIAVPSSAPDRGAEEKRAMPPSASVATSAYERRVHIKSKPRCNKKHLKYIEKTIAKPLKNVF